MVEPEEEEPPWCQKVFYEEEPRFDIINDISDLRGFQHEQRTITHPTLAIPCQTLRYQQQQVFLPPFIFLKVYLQILRLFSI